VNLGWIRFGVHTTVELCQFNGADLEKQNSKVSIVASC
jgi:hypothetical protein